MNQPQRPQPLTLKQLAAHFPHQEWLSENRVRVRSPLRKDKTASVYLSEAPNGNLLIKDFGGNSIYEILDAINVDIQSLFPAKAEHYVKPTPARMAAIELVRFLKSDLVLVLTFARMVQKGEKPTESDFTKLGEVIDRLHDGINFGGWK